MEAPEKIYLQACGDCQDNECGNCEFGDLEHSSTWCKDRIFEKDIEYSRTDAFIEKAAEWFRAHWRDYVGINKDNVIHFGPWENDFKNYMKGNNQ